MDQLFGGGLGRVSLFSLGSLAPKRNTNLVGVGEKSHVFFRVFFFLKGGGVRRPQLQKLVSVFPESIVKGSSLDSLVWLRTHRQNLHREVAQRPCPGNLIREICLKSDWLRELAERNLLREAYSEKLVQRPCSENSTSFPISFLSLN